MFVDDHRPERFPAPAVRILAWVGTPSGGRRTAGHELLAELLGQRIPGIVDQEVGEFVISHVATFSRIEDDGSSSELAGGLLLPTTSHRHADCVLRCTARAGAGRVPGHARSATRSAGRTP